MEYRQPPPNRLPWLLVALVGLTVVAVGLPNRMLAQWAYAVERGRIQAGSEELAHAEEVSHAFRLVARVARPGVVHIQASGDQEAQDELKEVNRRFRELRGQLEGMLEDVDDVDEVIERMGDDAVDADERGAMLELWRELQRLDARRDELTEQMREASGSGILFDDEGHVLTNNHVIDGRNDIRVQLHDDRAYDAVLVGSDAETDLALLKISADDVHPLRFGDSDKMEVGDWVLAVGAPFGLSHTVTHGIISARGRTHIATGSRRITYQNFLQTDAAINPGNSGGPLLNLRGEVIGINTAIATNGDAYNAGIAFTIPSNMAVKIGERLRDAGEVARGWLGVSMVSLERVDFEILRVPDGGVMVGTVIADTPANQAGIQVEDVVVAINEIPVRTDSEMLGVIGDIFPGERAKIDLVRNGEPRQITVQLDRRPPGGRVARGDMAVNAHEITGWGILSRTLLPSEAESRGFDESDRGALVWAMPRSLAGAGYEPGDLIVEVDGEPIRTSADLVDKFAATRSGRRVTVGLLGVDGDRREIRIRKQ